MRLFANLLWMFLGDGVILFILYSLGALILCLTIIGIPFGIQKLKLAIFALAPFGLEIKDNQSASGCLAIIFNILWIICGGFWISITHIVFAFIFTITIIGIPFAKQHLKMAHLAIVPFGRNAKK